MNAKAAVDMLLDAFPALRGPTAHYIAEWERDGDDNSSPGLYNLFGDVFFPQLIKPLVESDPEDATALTDLFRAIELMAAQGDQQVETFVRFGICERLGDSDAWLGRAVSYIGPRTLALCKAVEELWGRDRKR